MVTTATNQAEQRTRIESELADVTKRIEKLRKELVSAGLQHAAELDTARARIDELLARERALREGVVVHAVNA